jgi:hypothetical protein
MSNTIAFSSDGSVTALRPAEVVCLFVHHGQTSLGSWHEPKRGHARPGGPAAATAGPDGINALAPVHC